MPAACPGASPSLGAEKSAISSCDSDCAVAAGHRNISANVKKSQLNRFMRSTGAWFEAISANAAILANKAEDIRKTDKIAMTSNEECIELLCHQRTQERGDWKLSKMPATRCVAQSPHYQLSRIRSGSVHMMKRMISRKIGISFGKFDCVYDESATIGNHCDRRDSEGCVA